MRNSIKSKSKKVSPQEKYNEWWLGKLVILPLCFNQEPKRVREIRLYGPPSFVSGEVELVFEDGSEQLINTPPGVYKPRKQDVIVVKEEISVNNQDA